MIDNIDYLFALLNTCVALIAFATIVATLLQSFGTLPAARQTSQSKPCKSRAKT